MIGWWVCLRRRFSCRGGKPADPVLEESLRRAVERLLEDEGLTADLVDEAAGRLLAWGREQARLVLQQEAGATEDHPRLIALRRRMREIARQVGQLPPEKQAEVLQAMLSENNLQEV